MRIFNLSPIDLAECCGGLNVVLTANIPNLDVRVSGYYKYLGDNMHKVVTPYGEFAFHTMYIDTIVSKPTLGGVFVTINLAKR